MASNVLKEMLSKVDREKIELPDHVFDTPCKVLIFDKDKRSTIIEKLKSFGYVDNTTEGDSVIAADAYHGCIISSSTLDDFQSKYYVNCGDNTELFCSLAAMNRYNDLNQWFIWEDPNDEGEPMMLCTHEFIKDQVGKEVRPGGPTLQNWHLLEVRKANVYQIINHYL